LRESAWPRWGHWTSIPKVSGSIPTVVRQTFQPARCGFTLRVTSQIWWIYFSTWLWEYIQFLKFLTRFASSKQTWKVCLVLYL
jgi:hypothetical protein